MFIAFNGNMFTFILIILLFLIGILKIGAYLTMLIWNSLGFVQIDMFQGLLVWLFCIFSFCLIFKDNIAFGCIFENDEEE